jgi:1,4-dihydroxy-2-naphthoyl-CoA hydrolase
MSIWFTQHTLEVINLRGAGTFSESLGIFFTAIESDSLTASMPVTESIKQPVGIVHGGANVVLAETVASTAANLVVDSTSNYCVGLEINANHLRSVREGTLYCTTTPIHLGRKTHVWHIEIKNEEGKMTCISRMTAAVLQRPK